MAFLTPTSESARLDTALDSSPSHAATLLAQKPEEIYYPSSKASRRDKQATAMSWGSALRSDSSSKIVAVLPVAFIQ